LTLVGRNDIKVAVAIHVGKRDGAVFPDTDVVKESRKQELILFGEGVTEIASRGLREGQGANGNNCNRGCDTGSCRGSAAPSMKIHPKIS
jgi:hypothetical protein